jgi:hypothetical protein
VRLATGGAHRAPRATLLCQHSICTIFFILLHKKPHFLHLENEKIFGKKTSKLTLAMLVPMEICTVVQYTNPLLSKIIQAHHTQL